MEPTVITTAKQLENMKPDGNYVLGCDITTNVGIGNFYGNLDRGEFKIDLVRFVKRVITYKEALMKVEELEKKNAELLDIIKQASKKKPVKTDKTNKAD